MDGNRHQTAKEQEQIKMKIGTKTTIETDRTPQN